MQSGREQANDLAEGREEKDLPAVEMSEISATDSEGSEVSRPSCIPYLKSHMLTYDASVSLSHCNGATALNI